MKAAQDFRRLLGQMDHDAAKAEAYVEKETAALPEYGLIRGAPLLPKHPPDWLLLLPFPTDLGLAFDREWRSFAGNAGKKVRLDIRLFLARALRAAVRLLQEPHELTASQCFVLGHNIGVLRMLLRADSDQLARRSQAKHAKEYQARKRALQFFSKLKEIFPDRPFSSDNQKVLDIDSMVIRALEGDGFGTYGKSAVGKWRRSGTPKAQRRRGARLGVRRG